MKVSLPLLISALALCVTARSQVDTTYIYNTDTPYGTLDVRIRKSESRYYFLEEGVTFSFRESASGVKTNTFKDMTAWDSSPYTEGNLREQVDDQSNFVMNYRLLKPNSYNDSYDPGYPLLIMFHGSGETGNCWNSNCFHADQNYSPLTNDPPAPTDPEHELLNNDHNLLHGGKVYLDAVNLAGEKLPNDPALDDRAFPGFVLFPQNLNGWSGGTVQDAIRIIRLLCKKYNIDEDRIYIHGLSNGGYGVYEALKRTPWMFASAIVMSAVSDGFITNTNMESEIADIKLWIFQGALDSNPYPQKTRRYVDQFRVAGAEVRYTEYADVGHTVWNKAYKEPDFFTWFLGQRKSQIHAFGGTPVICSEEGLLLELPEGYLSYQWEKDGNIIEGASSATYAATEPGKYRGRFSRLSSTPSEEQWNEWSDEVDVTTQSPPESAIMQTGTVLLKDLNGANEANLQSDRDYAHYYWYKDGSLLDLPGSQDDTLKSIVIQAGSCSPACTGNGVYTLVTADYGNCKSNPSEPKYVFFSEQAPVNITPPSEFTGGPTSASSIELQWKDNGTTELGYEIWHRIKTGDSEFSPWEMVALTNADEQSFIDENLQPFAVYQYKIRAAGTSGRSKYTPENDVLEVSTSADTSPPSAPSNVNAVRTGLKRFLLTWEHSEDDTQIRNYIVKSEAAEYQLASPDTFFIVDNLAIDTVYTFSVRAVDLSSNESEESPGVTVATDVAGLFYEHSPGGWTSLDSVDWSHAEYTGMVDNFTLGPKTQEDYFNFRFDGYLYLESEGDYNFRITSDDGSRLLIDSVLVADNDGIHEMTAMESGTQSLTAGAHRITVHFFEYFNTDSLIVEYNGPDTQNEWKVIPDEALKSNRVIATEPDVNDPLVVDVFPNPTSAYEIRLRVQSIRPNPVQIILIDALGKSILTETYDVDDTRYGVQLSPTETVQNGMYLLKVAQGEKIIVRKLMIKNQ
jgi:hypothetical protein